MVDVQHETRKFKGCVLFDGDCPSEGESFDKAPNFIRWMYYTRLANSKVVCCLMGILPQKVNPFTRLLISYAGCTTPDSHQCAVVVRGFHG